MRRRLGRPGLVGTMARTAVVAGTATAVSNRVTSHQQAKAQAEYDQQQAAYEQQAPAQQPAEQQQPPAALPPSQDPIERLRELAELKQQGILTDEEFTAMKAKLINS